MPSPPGHPISYRRLSTLARETKSNQGVTKFPFFDYQIVASYPTTFQSALKNEAQHRTGTFTLFKYATQVHVSGEVFCSLASGNLIWYLHTIRRHSMLRFHIKKNAFTSILTLTSNACISMQCGKSTVEYDKVIWWDACWKNKLSRCF